MIEALCDVEDILRITKAGLRSLDTECWLFRCRTDKDGYALIEAGGKTHRGHRLSWESLVGPIPEGYDLDHLCRERSCLRPLHLDAVDHDTNIERMLSEEVWRAAVLAAGLAPLLEEPEEQSLFDLAEVPHADAFSRYAS